MFYSTKSKLNDVALLEVSDDSVPEHTGHINMTNFYSDVYDGGCSNNGMSDCNEPSHFPTLANNQQNSATQSELPCSNKYTNTSSHQPPTVASEPSSIYEPLKLVKLQKILQPVESLDPSYPLQQSDVSTVVTVDSPIHRDNTENNNDKIIQVSKIIIQYSNVARCKTVRIASRNRSVKTTIISKQPLSSSSIQDLTHMDSYIQQHLGHVTGHDNKNDYKQSCDKSRFTTSDNQHVIIYQIGTPNIRVVELILTPEQFTPSTLSPSGFTIARAQCLGAGICDDDNLANDDCLVQALALLSRCQIVPRPDVENNITTEHKSTHVDNIPTSTIPSDDHVQHPPQHCLPILIINIGGRGSYEERTMYNSNSNRVAEFLRNASLVHPDVPQSYMSSDTIHNESIYNKTPVHNCPNIIHIFYDTKTRPGHMIRTMVWAAPTSKEATLCRKVLIESNTNKVNDQSSTPSILHPPPNTINSLPKDRSDNDNNTIVSMDEPVYQSDESGRRRLVQVLHWGLTCLSSQTYRYSLPPVKTAGHLIDTLPTLYFSDDGNAHLIAPLYNHQLNLNSTSTTLLNKNRWHVMNIQGNVTAKGTFNIIRGTIIEYPIIKHVHGKYQLVYSQNNKLIKKNVVGDFESDCIINTRLASNNSSKSHLIALSEIYNMSTIQNIISAAMDSCLLQLANIPSTMLPTTTPLFSTVSADLAGDVLHYLNENCKTSLKQAIDQRLIGINIRLPLQPVDKTLETVITTTSHSDTTTSAIHLPTDTNTIPSEYEQIIPSDSVNKNVNKSKSALKNKETFDTRTLLRVPKQSLLLGKDDSSNHIDYTRNRVRSLLANKDAPFKL